jgi:polyisoprenoid-binding protein YceI
MKRTYSVALMLLFVAGVAGAQTTPGKITIVGKQMGAPIDGEFKKFTAQIQLDPTKPEAGKAIVEIDVASIDIGLEDFNQELRSKTWFDAKNHPKASFVSTSIKPAGNDRLEARGKLTIKGKTQDVSIPLTVKTQAGARVYEGTIAIKRTAFNIGEGDWKDTSIVADDVQVRFRIQAPSK